MEPKNIYKIKFQENRQRIVSTILIPQIYYLLFETHKNRLKKNTNDLLEHLLKRFSLQRGDILTTQTDQSTTGYQDSGQNLIKHNFSVTPVNWQRMKSLAHLHGVSICQFFIILLLLSNAENVGTPRELNLSQKITVFEKINFLNFHIFREYQIQKRLLKRAKE